MKLETIDRDCLSQVLGRGSSVGLLGGSALKEVSKWGGKVHGYQFRPARSAVTPPPGQHLGDRQHALDHNLTPQY